MKGQDEALIFLLLFIIGIALFTAATIWSKGIFQQNVDLAKVQSAEKFIKDIDSVVSNIIKFGGSQEIKYNLDGTIELFDKKTIELKVPVKLNLSSNWVNISSDGSFIQEKSEGGSTFRIQLVYNNTKEYNVEFFTEGSRVSMPSYIIFERNSTYSVSGMTVIKIKVTFA